MCRSTKAVYNPCLSWREIVSRARVQFFETSQIIARQCQNVVCRTIQSCLCPANKRRSRLPNIHSKVDDKVLVSVHSELWSVSRLSWSPVWSMNLSKSAWAINYTMWCILYLESWKPNRDRHVIRIAAFAPLSTIRSSVAIQKIATKIHDWEEDSDGLR